MTSRIRETNYICEYISNLHDHGTINDTDEIGYNLLHYAVKDNNELMVNFLLEAGADVNSKTKNNNYLHKDCTPLKLLLTEIYPKIIEPNNTNEKSKQTFENIKNILLDYGADHRPLIKFLKEAEITLKLIKQKLGITDQMIYKNNKMLHNQQVVQSCADGNLGLEPIYSNFYKFLQSRLNKFVTELKTKTGDWFKNERSYSDMAIDKVSIATLSHIPEVGKYLVQGYQFLSDRQQLQKYKKHMNHLSDHFINYGYIDEIISDYAARITEYYKEEILQPDDDISFIQGMQDKITDLEANISLIKPVIAISVASYLTKLPPEQIIEKYQRNGEIIFKKHWDSLAAKAILKFLNYLKDNNVNYSMEIGIEVAKVVIPKWIFEPLFIDSRSTDFSLNNAYGFGVICKFVYENKMQVKSIAQKWHYDNCYIWNEQYLQAVVMYDNDKLILAFRGTYHDINWLKNIDVRTQAITVGNKVLYVHNGFIEATNILWKSKDCYNNQFLITNIISDYLQNYPGSKIYVTGHSLGGAMASMAYLLLIKELNISIDQLALYTYGQPLWCRSSSYEESISLFANNYHRIVNYLDIVPQIPSADIIKQLSIPSILKCLIDFIHIGKQYFLHRDGRMLDETQFEIIKQRVNSEGYNEIPDRLLSSSLYVDHHYMEEYLLHLEKEYKLVNNTAFDRYTKQRQQFSLTSVYSDSTKTGQDKNYHQVLYFQITSKAKKLLEQGYGLDYVDEGTGLTLLHTASEEGDVEVVKDLLNNGKFKLLNNLDQYGRSALDLAISNNHGFIATILLKANVEIGNDCVNGGMPISCWAAKYGYNEAFRLIIGHNQDLLYAVDQHNYTPLYWAVRNNHAHIVEYILSLDSSIIEKKYDFGSTVLWKAAEKNHDLIAEIIIKYGADVNTASEYKTTALNLALSRGHFEVAKLLIFNNAAYEAKSYISMDEDGNSLLHLCCIMDNLEDLYLFLIQDQEFENQIARTNNNGRNIYDLALEHDRSLILEELIYNNRVGLTSDQLYDKNGYHVLAKTDEIRKLSRIYKSLGWEISITEARKGININKTNEKGNTILYEIIVVPSHSEKEMDAKLSNIQILISCGIDIKYTARNNGFTPIMVASLSGQNSIAELLKDALPVLYDNNDSLIELVGDV